MTIQWLSNAGIFVQGEKGSVLVDGLHGQVPRFSGTPKSLARQVVSGEGSFSSVSIALVTHQHADHWDARLVFDLLQAHPETVLVSPVLPKGGPAARMIRIDGDHGSLSVQQIHVNYLKVPHEGEQFSHIANYAYRVWLGDGSFIVTGDAAIEQTAMAVEELTDGIPAEGVFVDFPLLTLSAGRKQLANMRAGKLYAFHLPFEEHDVDGFRKSAAQALERYGAPVTLLLDPGQQEVL